MLQAILQGSLGFLLERQLTRVQPQGMSPISSSGLVIQVTIGAKMRGVRALQHRENMQTDALDVSPEVSSPGSGGYFNKSEFEKSLLLRRVSG